MPIVVGYTKKDLKIWTELVARILTAGGITKDDVIQIAFNYGLFTGAFGFHYGAEKRSKENPFLLVNQGEDCKLPQQPCSVYLFHQKYSQEVLRRD